MLIFCIMKKFPVRIPYRDIFLQSGILSSSINKSYDVQKCLDTFYFPEFPDSLT